MTQQRGRKSASQLAIVSPTTPGQRPAPPKNLPPEEAAIWTRIINAMPDGWFSTSYHMLQCLCSHVVTADVIAARLAKARATCDEKTLNRWALMLRRETHAIAVLSQALRLPPRARYTQERSTNLKVVAPETTPWNRGRDK
jgi:hypothetical protein